MYPIFFSIGSLNIYSHGVMTVLGALVGFWVIYKLSQKEKILNFVFLEFALAVMIGGFIGARILYILVYPDQFSTFLDLLYFWNGGMVSFGGILGGIIAAAIYLANKRQNIWQWFDISIFGLMIGQGIGRIGCFLNSDVNGYYTLSKIAVWARYPVSLFESSWIVIFLPFLYLLYLKKRGKWPHGIIFAIGLIAYGFGRFIIEFLRDDFYLLGWLKYGQIGSLITIFIAIILILVIFKLKRERRIK